MQRSGILPQMWIYCTGRAWLAQQTRLTHRLCTDHPQRPCTSSSSMRPSDAGALPYLAWYQVPRPSWPETWPGAQAQRINPPRVHFVLVDNDADALAFSRQRQARLVSCCLHTRGSRTRLGMLACICCGSQALLLVPSVCWSGLSPFFAERAPSQAGAWLAVGRPGQA